MSPIQVGLIGLGTSAAFPGAWAATAHLPSLLSSPYYEIVALCNSSVDSAKQSIVFHKLPDNVRAYGSPHDLANDKDVDLVVLSVQVPRHYALIKPILLAGKDALVEWPLGATTAEAEELLDIARSKNLKNFLGCQARADPFVLKIRELVNRGKIGKVLSTTVNGTMAPYPAQWPEGVEFYTDITSAGNVVNIWFGHFLDTFLQTLGNFKSLTSILDVVQHTIVTVDSAGNIVNEAYPKTVPDQVFVQGLLESGAVASVAYRKGPAKSVDQVGVRWIISGTEGEISVTIPEAAQWQSDTPGRTIKICVGDGEIEDVDFSDPNEPSYVSQIGPFGRNTARAYEAFAKGESEKYPNFEQGLVLHRLLDAIIAGHM